MPGDQRPGRSGLGLLLAALVMAAGLLVTPPAQALQMKVEGTRVVASGRVDDGDALQWRAVLAVQPKASELVLVNTSGNDVRAALALARLVAQQGVATTVVGVCSGTCVLVQAAGRKRRFGPDVHPRRSWIAMPAPAAWGADAADAQAWLRQRAPALGQGDVERLLRPAAAATELRWPDPARNPGPAAQARLCPSDDAPLSACRAPEGVANPDALAARAGADHAA